MRTPSHPVPEDASQPSSTERERITRQAKDSTRLSEKGEEVVSTPSASGGPGVEGAHLGWWSTGALLGGAGVGVLLFLTGLPAVMLQIGMFLAVCVGCVLVGAGVGFFVFGMATDGDEDALMAGSAVGGLVGLGVGVWHQGFASHQTFSSVHHPGAALVVTCVLLGLLGAGGLALGLVGGRWRRQVERFQQVYDAAWPVGSEGLREVSRAREDLRRLVHAAEKLTLHRAQEESEATLSQVVRAVSQRHLVARSLVSVWEMGEESLEILEAWREREATVSRALEAVESLAEEVGELARRDEEAREAERAREAAEMRSLECEKVKELAFSFTTVDVDTSGLREMVDARARALHSEG